MIAKVNIKATMTGRILRADGSIEKLQVDAVIVMGPFTRAKLWILVNLRRMLMALLHKLHSLGG
jgi:hypothetical protein